MNSKRLGDRDPKKCHSRGEQLKSSSPIPLTDTSAKATEGTYFPQ